MFWVGLATPLSCAGISFTRSVCSQFNLALNISSGQACTNLWPLVPMSHSLIVKTSILWSIQVGFDLLLKTSWKVSVYFMSLHYVLKDYNKVSLKPSLLKAHQPRLTHLFFTAEVFQPSDHFFFLPPLGSLWQANIILDLGCSILDVVW